jgi:hypothetical protein
VQGYKNGTSIVSVSSDTSVAVQNGAIVFGAGDSASSFSTGQFMMGGFGSSITPTDVTNLYSRTHTLLQAIAGIA